jgi:hypothetical protein
MPCFAACGASYGLRKGRFRFLRGVVSKRARSAGVRTHACAWPPDDNIEQGSSRSSSAAYAMVSPPCTFFAAFEGAHLNHLVAVTACHLRSERRSATRVPVGYVRQLNDQCDGRCTTDHRVKSYRIHRIQLDHACETWARGLVYACLQRRSMLTICYSTLMYAPSSLRFSMRVSPLIRTQGMNHSCCADCPNRSLPKLQDNSEGCKYTNK